MGNSSSKIESSLNSSNPDKVLKGLHSISKHVAAKDEKWIKEVPWLSILQSLCRILIDCNGKLNARTPQATTPAELQKFQQATSSDFDLFVHCCSVLRDLTLLPEHVRSGHAFQQHFARDILLPAFEIAFQSVPTLTKEIVRTLHSILGEQVVSQTGSASSEHPSASRACLAAAPLPSLVREFCVHMSAFRHLRSDWPWNLDGESALVRKISPPVTQVTPPPSSSGSLWGRRTPPPSPPPPPQPSSSIRSVTPPPSPPHGGPDSDQYMLSLQRVMTACVESAPHFPAVVFPLLLKFVQMESEHQNFTGIVLHTLHSVLCPLVEISTSSSRASASSGGQQKSDELASLSAIFREITVVALNLASSNQFNDTCLVAVQCLHSLFLLRVPGPHTNLPKLFTLFHSSFSPSISPSDSQIVSLYPKVYKDTMREKEEEKNVFMEKRDLPPAPVPFNGVIGVCAGAAGAQSSPTEILFKIQLVLAQCLCMFIDRHASIANTGTCCNLVLHALAYFSDTFTQFGPDMQPNERVIVTELLKCLTSVVSLPGLFSTHAALYHEALASFLAKAVISIRDEFEEPIMDCLTSLLTHASSNPQNNNSQFPHLFFSQLAHVSVHFTSLHNICLRSLNFTEPKLAQLLDATKSFSGNQQTSSFIRHLFCEDFESSGIHLKRVLQNHPQIQKAFLGECVVGKKPSNFKEKSKQQQQQEDSDDLNMDECYFSPNASPKSEHAKDLGNLPPSLNLAEISGAVSALLLPPSTSTVSQQSPIAGGASSSSSTELQSQQKGGRDLFISHWVHENTLNYQNQIQENVGGSGAQLSQNRLDRAKIIFGSLFGGASQKKSDSADAQFLVKQREELALSLDDILARFYHDVSCIPRSVFIRSFDLFSLGPVHELPKISLGQHPTASQVEWTQAMGILSKSFEDHLTHTYRRLSSALAITATRCGDSPTLTLSLNALQQSTEWYGHMYPVAIVGRVISRVLVEVRNANRDAVVSQLQKENQVMRTKVAELTTERDQLQTSHKEAKTHLESAKKDLKTLQDSFTCAVCLDNFLNLGPTALPNCGHILCSECARHLAASGRAAKCPLCRKDIGPVSGLVKLQGLN